MVVLFPTPQTPCLSQKPEIIAPSVIIKALNKLQFIFKKVEYLNSYLLIKKKEPKLLILKMGRIVGFEPTHIGTTIRGLNRLTISAMFPTILSISNKDFLASKRF